MKKILLGIATIICGFTLTASNVLVTNTNDSGTGSLRTAMQTTVQNGDTIRFSPSLISNGSDTITFLTPIYTGKDITVVGLYNSTDTLFLSGGTTQQLFYISHYNSSAINKSLTLDSVVMIDGSATRGGHMYFAGNDLTIKNSVFRNGQKSIGTALEGGSIAITDMSVGASDLTILNSKFYNNKAQTGGAIFSRSVQTVTITNSQLYNNEGTTHGGGIVIFDPANVTVLNATFNDNTTAGNGGGLYCTRFSTGYSPVVNLNITSSSFYDNTANSGAGIQVLNVTPTVNIKTSTFNYNIAAAGGGGIDVRWDGNNNSATHVTIENSTITRNYNTSTYFLGSGIFIENSYYQTNEFLTLKGSIIADNGTNSTGRNIRFSGTINNGGSGLTSNGHNLLGEPSIPLSTFHPTDVASVSGAQLNLGVIQNNGGLTPTRLPGTGSIAINKGDTLDVMDAQNGAITDGFRDAGAAEYRCIIRTSIAPNACVSYASPSGNYTWTTSGMYTDTISGNGCDTIYSVNLSINNTTVTLNETTCGSYTSPNGKIWTASGTYLDTITNASGCDSLMTFNLIINQSSTSSLSRISCGNYISPSGKTITTSGIIADTITNTNGCDSIMSINVTVLNINNTVTVNSISLNANESGAAYKWLDCLNSFAPISGEISQTFTPLINGSYAVEITKNGCTDTSTCNNITAVGINEADLKDNFDLYPNPTNGTLIIKTEYDINSIEVLSLMGKVVYSSNSTNFSIENLSAGTYIVRVLTDKGEISKLVVKN
jgi:predicted outer membrane repeat protein